MKHFSKEAYIAILRACKGHIIDTRDPGPGIILRHDIDRRQERALRMAEIEASEGVRSVYFALQTRSWFNREIHLEELYRIQMMGHEIGWHNNALATWLRAKKRNENISLREIVRSQLNELRFAGLDISGTSSHGSKLCYDLGFLNYQIWEEYEDYRKKNEKRGWSENNRRKYRDKKVEHPVFRLREFALDYEIYFIGYDYYLTDSGRKWTGDWESIIEKAITEKKRLVILAHSSHWDV